MNGTEEIMPLDFDEIFVISDLHLGGIPGHQIFANQPELISLLNHIRGRPEKLRVVLVINGDLVDFLAEPNARYLDAEGATERLNRIRNDDIFRPIFDAFAALVQTPNRFLAITLGNHDLELALPHVRQHLAHLLCGDREDAHARLMLAFDGAGFACRIAEQKVLCLHGNEVDDWNLTDWEQLRRVGCDYTQRGQTSAWTPNAGTKLVVDVMNSMKQDFAFIDLLKPEKQAVLPILAALDRGRSGQLGDIARVALRLRVDQAKRAIGLLGAEDEPLPGVPVSRRTGPQLPAEELMRYVNQHHARGTTPLDLVPADGNLSVLGWVEDVKAWAGEKQLTLLRKALRGLLGSDESFNWRAPDETFVQIDRLVSPNFSFVLTGHTHLERSLGRVFGQGRYFNTGAWTGLMRIEPETLESDDNFAAYFDAIRGSSSIAALERQGVKILRRPAVAWLRRAKAKSSEVEAALLRVRIKDQKLQLTPVNGDN